MPQSRFHHGDVITQIPPMLTGYSTRSPSGEDYGASTSSTTGTPDSTSTRSLIHNPNKNRPAQAATASSATPYGTVGGAHELQNMADVQLKDGSQTNTGTTGDNIMTTSTMSNESTSSRIVTMTGTIKRGQKQGEMVQVQLQLSEEEINRLHRKSIMEDENTNDCIWGLKKGLHILLFSVLFIPFAFIASLCMAFYIGTMAWYNIYLYLSEERTVWHKIFLCPLLIISFPFLIVLSALGVSIYAGFVQVSWYLTSWYKEVRDFEKGFYGWVCHKLQVPQCAPYEVVILDDDVTRVIGERSQISTTQV